MVITFKGINFYTFIKNDDDFLEHFHEIHIVKTKILYFDKKGKLRTTIICKGS